MNGLWITYFVSFGLVILFTALTKFMFTSDGGEEFNVSHIIILDLIAGIPFVGTLEAFVIISMLFLGCITGELEPKHDNENN